VAQDGIKSLLKVVKYSAKKRGLEYALHFVEARALMTSPCFYCGSPPRERVIKVQSGRDAADLVNVAANGIDRIDSDQGYIPGNVVSCCYTCNRMKSDFSVQEFMNHVGRLAQRLELVKTNLEIVLSEPEGVIGELGKSRAVR
jgi:hypothetical protein